MSEEMRMLDSLRNSGKNHPQYGKHRSEETKRKIALKHCKPVIQFTKTGKLIKEYPSAKEAQRQTGVLSGSISQCCLGRKNHSTAGGYIWKYA